MARLPLTAARRLSPLEAGPPSRGAGPLPLSRVGNGPIHKQAHGPIHRLCRNGTIRIMARTDELLEMAESWKRLAGGVISPALRAVCLEQHILAMEALLGHRATLHASHLGGAGLGTPRKG